MLTKVEVNAQTGERVERELTPEEIAALPEPVERGPADLTPAQFEFLLALTGFGEIWDAMAEQAKASGDMTTFATLKAERKRSRFRLDVVLATVSSMAEFAAQVAPDVDLSEAAIKAAWAQAEAYKGITE